ncbi:hypothetical protein BST92_03790 [Nonlabens arenilitoris]|uniref:Uncharacterized protein n=1 Tax=Nonlabens arenilitoris TaxID=1217969 RepID=A0A2S7U831_9FLAO|nr:hypothetical protein [Nonlabens arenilitoris]PQJ31099.1 hypothetical protein BST92_03790 [Nonlabens arenilitoris]
MENKKNGYDLSRNWFNWCYENPEKIKPIHTAIYFYAVEICNRSGWKEKFGFPSQMVMESIGIKNWKTYIKALNDLIEFKFINMIEKSKNQHTSCIISLESATVKTTEALNKALSKQNQEHVPKQVQCTVSINKPITKKKEPRDKDLSPFDLISKEKASELKTWEKNNCENVHDYDDLIEAFNNTTGMEILSQKDKLEFNADMLILRFKNYANAWIRNQKGGKVVKLENTYDPDYVYFTTNTNSTEQKISATKFEAYRANEEKGGRVFTIIYPQKSRHAN